jgi:hypothetical protein
MINVTWAITVCNELKEITELINFLHPRIKDGDEILIQYDETGVTPEVKGYLDIIDKLHQNIKVIGFPLNGDFATFKNNLKNHSNGIFIVNVDADEIPNEYLVDNIHMLLEYNKDVDMFFVPRINTVDGITDEHIKKWGWKVNERGWINAPDYQTRIYRRTSDIEWVGKVHERIVGYNTLSVLPFDEEYCLYHHKDISRQTLQNEFYETL